MYRKLNLSLMALASLSCFSAHADDCCERVCKQETCLMKPVSLYEVRDNLGVSFGVRADVLYMNYSRPEVTFASEMDVSVTSLNNNIIPAKSHAEVGLDVAVNYTMEECPEYTFELGWFYIKPKWSRTITSPVLHPSHLLTADGTAPGTGSNNASLDMNLVDLTISKAFSLGKYFSFTPVAGVVGGSLNSHNNAYFHATSGTFSADPTIIITDYTYLQHVKYKGIGAKVGTGYGFDVWNNFGIVGDISVNMLYGFSKVSLNATESPATPPSIFNPLSAAANYSQHHGMVYLDSLLGLSWKGSFDCNSMFLDVHVGWRYQSFYPGMIHIQGETDNSLYERSFSGQGLEAGLTFKF